MSVAALILGTPSGVDLWKEGETGLSISCGSAAQGQAYIQHTEGLVVTGSQYEPPRTISAIRLGTRFEFLDSSGKLLSLSLALFTMGVSRRNIYRLENTLRWRRWNKTKRSEAVTSGPEHLTSGTGSPHSAMKCDFMPLEML